MMIQVGPTPTITHICIQYIYIIYKHICRELTYPTLEKGKSSSIVPWSVLILKKKSENIFGDVGAATPQKNYHGHQKFTIVERKILFLQPSFLGSMFVFQGVIVIILKN